MSDLVNAALRTGYRAAHLVLRSYWRVRHPETRGALVALWSERKLLLIKSSYRDTYSLPGGYLRPGEPARLAAQRELAEELGLKLPMDELREAWHGSLPFEHRTDTLTIFEAEIKQPFRVEPNQRELIWAGWKSPEEALAMDVVPHVRAYLQVR